MHHLEFTPIVVVHLIAALGAVVIGGLTLAMRKGTKLHKLLGRTWVVLMLGTALVSFGIQRNGHFSAIHLLSVFVLFAVTASLVAAMRGRIKSHRRGMINAYIGVVIAGLFALAPTRSLGYFVWHAAGLV